MHSSRQLLDSHFSKLMVPSMDRKSGSEIEAWIYSLVASNLLRYGKVPCRTSAIVLSAVNPETFIAKIKEVFSVDIIFMDSVGSKSRNDFSFVNEDLTAMVNLYSTKKDDLFEYEYVILSENKEAILAFEKFSKKDAIDNKKNLIYVISSNASGGLALHSMGSINASLEIGNYNQEANDAFTYISSEYNKKEPYGRLSIINGPPGTGKTYFVRGLLSQIKNSLIILLPTKLVSEVDSPSLIRLLAEEREFGVLESNEKAKNMPILFVIEDADLCLVPRDDGNSSTISSLLNYTDGIFGSMLDLRIIATTNADKIEFDQALTRPGRLCKHLRIGHLSPDQASEVYSRVSGKSKEYDKEVTLAEVYQDVHGVKVGEKKEKKPLGFGV